MSPSDYYGDFVEGEEYKEFFEIKKSMIINIYLPLYIHEEFDNLEIIEDLKDQVLDLNLCEIKKGEERIFDKYMDLKNLKYLCIMTVVRKLYFLNYKKFTLK